MFSRLLTTTTRHMSASYRKVVKCPVKGGDKLTTSGLGVFMKENYKKAAKGTTKPLKVFAALRKQFHALSEQQAAKYKTVAKDNARKAASRKSVFKQARIGSYTLFFKQSYAKVAKDVAGEGIQKGIAVAKLVGKQWKALGKAGQAKYAAAAAQLRRAAVHQRDVMMRKYSA